MKKIKKLKLFEELDYEDEARTIQSFRKAMTVEDTLAFWLKVKIPDEIWSADLGTYKGVK